MIKKAIIPVAGLASRFLPASKVIPKSMFPIGDKPIIQHIVEDAVKAGITEIAIILSPNQDCVKEHFTINHNLIKNLEEKNKTKEIQILQNLEGLAKFHFYIQKDPKGDGDAIKCAKEFFENEEAVMILFGDELIFNETNSCKQLINHYNGSTIVGTVQVDNSEKEKYGIIEIAGNKAIKIIEKPKKGDTDSTTAIIGKYIVTNEVLNYLENDNIMEGQELRLVDALKTHLAKNGEITIHNISGARFDTGNQVGYIKAQSYYGSQILKI